MASLQMTPALVKGALAKEKNMAQGEMIRFGYVSPSGSKWRFAAVREDCKPFTITLTGRRMESHETWARRYVSLERAFLHVANNLNENAAVKDRYSTIEEWSESAQKKN